MARNRRQIYEGKAKILYEGPEPGTVIQNMVVLGLRQIWLVGGGELAASFMRHGLVDEYIVSIIPIILGDGLPLFQPPVPEQQFLVVESQLYSSGVVQIHYRGKRAV